MSRRASLPSISDPRKRAPVFHAAPAPSNESLQGSLDKIIDRIIRLLTRQGLEHLCRYITRSAIANERLSMNRAGQVIRSG